MHSFRHNPSFRRGLATIKVVAALPAFLMATWLGVEIGLGARAMNQARTASDAIALAAAARARDGHQLARADALAAAAASRGPNGPVSVTIGDGPGGGGDVEFGDWDETARTFTPNLAGGNAVRVRVRFAADHPNGTTAPVLSGLFGSGSMAVERVSIAVHVPSRHTTSMLVLGASGVTVSVADTAMVETDGGLSAASGDVAAVLVGPDAAVSATELRVAGGIDASSASQVDARVLQGFAVPADPFAALLLPSIDATTAQPIVHDNIQATTVPAGVHQGLVMSGGTVTLLAGLHQFTEPIDISGGTLVLQDATVQLDGGAFLSISGQGTIAGTPSASGDWAGAWVIQRGAQLPWSISGFASLEVVGLVYAPDAAVTVSGDAQVVADTAIMGSLSVAGASVFECLDSIDALATTPVPGRARLVR